MEYDSNNWDEVSIELVPSGVWSVELNKTDGDFSFNQHGRIKERDLHDVDAIALLEGQQFTIEQTKYERNAVARQKCIEQFGLSCQACFFKR